MTPLVHTETPHPHTDWIAAATPIRAVALSLHGLNMTPDKMQGIGHFFARHGVKVLNVSLAGHRGTAEDFFKPDRQLWLDECLIAYQQARAEADRLHVPLYFIGYSLGPLIYLDLVADPTYPDARFDKMLLLAPALATHNFTRLILGFGIFGHEFVIPSANVSEYSSNTGTPYSAYKALFQSQAALRKHRYAHLNVPTLLFISESDELVSLRKTRRLIRQYSLNNWKIEIVDNRESLLSPLYSHLMVDEDSFGSAEWARVTDIIAKEFDLK